MSRRPRLTSFTAPDGSVRELRDPDGPATPFQLAKLNRLGMVVVEAHPHEFEPLTKGEAAWLIDEARRRTGE